MGTSHYTYLLFFSMCVIIFKCSEGRNILCQKYPSKIESNLSEKMTFQIKIYCHSQFDFFVINMIKCIFSFLGDLSVLRWHSIYCWLWSQKGMRPVSHKHLSKFIKKTSNWVTVSKYRSRETKTPLISFSICFPDGDPGSFPAGRVKGVSEKNGGSDNSKKTVGR